MNKDLKIYVSGHGGLVGAALLRRLHNLGFHNIVYRSSAELDLRNQQATLAFFAAERPEVVFLAAAKVGGIQANSLYGGQFLYDNLMIQSNVIEAARVYGVKRLVFLGSSCIYPKLCPQPIKEEYLLTGPLEATNEPYAIAKIAGIKLCEAYNRQYGTHFVSVMPTNLYGENDNFHLENSHVLPALLRKFHEAKVNRLSTVTIWGTGKVFREFLHVDDMADACIFIAQKEGFDGLVNIGTGKDISIEGLALLIKEIVGYNGNLIFDTSKPDGTPKKLLDVRQLTAMGWQAKISLAEGIKQTYQWFLECETEYAFREV